MSESGISAHSGDPATESAMTKSEMDALAGLHSQLVDQLATLDRIGEHVAAAYLAAAIDVLDDRLAGDGRAVPDRQGGIVDDFSQRLAARLGPRAIEVARAQLASAEGRTLVVWSAIVNQLERADA